MKALVFKGKVEQVEENPALFPMHESLQWVECDSNVKPGWTYEQGMFSPPYVAPLSKAQLLIEYQIAVKEWLKQVARQKQYDTEASIVSYAGSTVALWQAEAQAFIAWRDSIYLIANDLMAAIDNEEAEIPTVSDFISSLPAIIWPS